MQVWIVIRSNGVYSLEQTRGGPPRFKLCCSPSRLSTRLAQSLHQEHRKQDAKLVKREHGPHTTTRDPGKAALLPRCVCLWLGCRSGRDLVGKQAGGDRLTPLQAW